MDYETLNKGVSRVAGQAHAARRVADHAALGALAARAGARVPALLVDARQLGRAFRVRHALGAAVRRRPSEARDARARGLVTGHPALGIRATGRRPARLRGCRKCVKNCGGKKIGFRSAFALIIPHIPNSITVFH